MGLGRLLAGMRADCRHLVAALFLLAAFLASACGEEEASPQEVPTQPPETPGTPEGSVAPSVVGEGVDDILPFVHTGTIVVTGEVTALSGTIPRPTPPPFAPLPSDDPKYPASLQSPTNPLPPTYIYSVRLLSVLNPTAALGGPEIPVLQEGIFEKVSYSEPFGGAPSLTALATDRPALEVGARYLLFISFDEFDEFDDSLGPVGTPYMRFRIGEDESLTPADPEGIKIPSVARIASLRLPEALVLIQEALAKVAAGSPTPPIP